MVLARHGPARGARDSSDRGGPHPLADLPELAGQHRLAAVRAHLLELAGEPAEARATYRLAARRTTSLPERRYLESRAARLS